MTNTSLTTGNLINGPVGKNKGAILHAGDYLQVNDYMYTIYPGHYAYFVVLQENGDLRFYYSTLNDFNACDKTQPYYSLVCDSGSAHIDPSWHFTPSQTGGQYFAIMQADGNFVIYRGTGPSNNKGPCWATNTYQAGQGPVYNAVLTTTGNLEVGVVPAGTTVSSQYPGLDVTWQSSLNQPGQPNLDYPSQRVRSGNCLQAGQWMTGNSELYSANLAYGMAQQQTGAITLTCAYPPGRPIVNAMAQSLTTANQYWTDNVSKPAGPCFTVMQADGNLCTYKGTDPGHNLGLYWAAVSTARPVGSYVAAIGNDGTLGVYSGTDPATASAPLWNNSGTASPLDQTLTIISGNNQTVTRSAANKSSLTGWYKAAPLSVRLIHANGVPVVGASVTFWLQAEVPGYGMNFSDPAGQTIPMNDPITVTSDSSGTATTDLWVTADAQSVPYGICAAPGSRAEGSAAFFYITTK